MKKLIVFLTLVILLLVTALPAGAITWGEPDTTHTNVGAMVVDFPDFGLLRLCSGTLIYPRVFLTAGHCTALVEDFGITEVWANFNEDALDFKKMKNVREVVEVITHPDYFWGPTSNPHDVGILILDKPPVRHLELATIPDQGFLDELNEAGKLEGAKFTVVGYGATLEWPPPLVNSVDNFRQSAQSEYQALLKSWLRMSQNQATGDGGTCGGDSGGPAFWTQPDGTEILVGVTSWGDVNCVATGFNYRVDTADTLDFIADVIAGLP